MSTPAPPGPGAGSALTPTVTARVGAVLFFVAGATIGVSSVLPLPEGQHRAALVVVSIMSALVGLVAWRAPWERWPAWAMRWTLVPAALALIAAGNSLGGLDPYTYDIAFPLVFAWVGLSQPRFTSVRLGVPAALVYLLPLVAVGRPADELFTVVVVIPLAVALGEACAWVGARLRATEAELRSAGAGLERFLAATTALSGADTEAEAASLTADFVLDLLGADRVLVMVAEEEGSSRLVSRGQRHVPAPVGTSVVDTSAEASGIGAAIRTGETVFVADVVSSPLVPEDVVSLVAAASAAYVPLPGEGGCLGAVLAFWDEPRHELDTFSQRAAEVISVEAGRVLERTRAAARLASDLGERGRAVALLERERKLLGLLRAVAVAANEARTMDEALQRAIDQICAYSAWPVGHAYIPDGEGGLKPTGLWHLDDTARFQSFRTVTEGMRLRRGTGLPGRVALTGRPLWISDVTTDPNFPRAEAASAAGLHAGFGVPVHLHGTVVAVLEFFFPKMLEPDDSLLELAHHVGTQLGRVAEREQAEMILRASEERLRAVLDTAGDAFVATDATGVVTEWNQQAERIFGWSRHEALGRPVADLIVPADLRPAYHAGLARFLTTGESAVIGRRVEMRALARDGREFPVEITVWSTPVGSTFSFNAFVHDISERKRLEAELTRQALHDALTGLPNRSLLVDRLEHALARGVRSGAPVTVLYLDLDGFKTINDSLGHAAGDRLLTAVAERLGECVRASDTVSRLGGDEFAIVLEGATAETGVKLAQRLLKHLDSPFSIQGRAVFARASIGVAAAELGHHATEDLLRNADLAMYMAKGQGKGRYAVFESGMHVAALQRLELEADLRRALGRGEFFLHYQPVVRLSDGSVVGTEALIRWEREGRVVSPAAFIPVAEEAGLIGEIGLWVLREACRQAAIWQVGRSPASPLELNVNLSARQLEDPTLLSGVEEALAASGLDPSHLVMEITETVLMSDPDVAVTRLRALKQLGVRVAVDDFGTGYSSLSYLRRFPVDILKIDRSFVGTLGGGPEDAALAHAIVKLAETLRLDVVAEGIETEAQLAELRSLGCEYGQGYYFSRPLSSDAFSALLAGDGMPMLPHASSSGTSNGFVI